MERQALQWDKQADVTNYGCSNLLLKQMQNEINQKQELVFLNCVIQQDVQCKSVLKMNQVSDAVTKIVNFIRAGALNHRQFVALL